MKKFFRNILFFTSIICAFSNLVIVNKVSAAAASSNQNQPLMGVKIKTNNSSTKQKQTVSLQAASTTDSCLTGSFYWNNAYVDPTTAYVSSTDWVGYFIDLYNVSVGDVITWTAYQPVHDSTGMPTGEFALYNSATLTRVDQQTWYYNGGFNNSYNIYNSSCNFNGFGAGPYIKGYAASKFPGPWQMTISYNGQVITTGNFMEVDDLAPTTTVSSPLSGTTIQGSATVTADMSDNLGVIKAELYADNVTTGQSYLVKTLNYDVPTNPFFYPSYTFNYSWDTTKYPDGNYNIRVVAIDPYNNKGSGTAGVIIANNPAPQPGSVPPTSMSLTPDPINIATGESFFSSTDFSLAARGSNLRLFRQYRSFSTIIGMFGYGWRTDFDINLVVDQHKNVTIYNEEGTAIYFTNNSGVYTPSVGNYSTLVKNADNTFTLTDKNGIITHYDINGRLSSRTDRNGNTLTFVYNPTQAGATYIQDAIGRQILFSFDSSGHVISAIDPAGKSFQYKFDANGNLISVTDPEGKVTNYFYNSNHKIIQLTNANGHNTYFQYDSQGRVTANFQDNNVNTVNLFYQAGNTTIVTDSLGNSNTYIFNPVGLMISHTDPLGAVIQQTWDPFLNRLSVTDARNYVTNFQYDIFGNLVQIIDPLGNKSSMSYTPDFHLLSNQTDALGDVTNFTYDNLGNLTSVTDALGKNHTFVYDQFGNVISATDSHGNSTHFNYDALSHMLQQIDAMGNNTVFSYK